MTFILDASVTLSWCFADEVTAETERLLDQAASGVVMWVPAIWPLEVTNVLLVAERKKRISYGESISFLKMLRKFQIEIDGIDIDDGFHGILTLAHTEKLTTYDASYLELALRKSLPLASKDRALCAVAKKLGIKTL